MVHCLRLTSCTEFFLHIACCFGAEGITVAGGAPKPVILFFQEGWTSAQWETTGLTCEALGLTYSTERK